MASFRRRRNRAGAGMGLPHAASRSAPAKSVGTAHAAAHIEALKHGGLDEPANMEWQSTDEAKAKDRTE
jgi:hypothetical protein